MGYSHEPIKRKSANLISITSTKNISRGINIDKKKKKSLILFNTKKSFEETKQDGKMIGQTNQCC